MQNGLGTRFRQQPEKKNILYSLTVNAHIIKIKIGDLVTNFNLVEFSLKTELVTLANSFIKAVQTLICYL